MDYTYIDDHYSQRVKSHIGQVQHLAKLIFQIITKIKTPKVL